MTNDTQDFLPFARPNISEAAIEAVTNCLRSGWITTGPITQQFEQALKETLGAPHVVCLNSATAGLHLSLLYLHLQPGDEVITTPLTFAATFNSIIHAKARPVLVDIDPNTLNIDVKKVEAAINKRTRAIVPVHFAGAPVDLEPLYQIAEKNHLRVIEDAAHAIGTHYHDEMIGSFGDTQVFSFHPTKTITSIEGGAIATHDEELADFARCVSLHGMSKHAWNRNAKSGNPNYDIVQPGFKYNMTDVQAAVGVDQLSHLESFIHERQRLAQSYHEVLSGWPQLTLPKPSPFPHRHSWHIFTVLLNPEQCGLNRDQFVKAMREHNIGIGIHYDACYLSDYFRTHYRFSEGMCPIAEDYAKRIVSLPLFPGMQQADVDRVIETMIKIFRS